MKDYKIKLLTYQPFDYDGIQSYLEKMAADGWRLESIGIFWRFRKADSAKVHYSVVFLPKASQYDPEETPVLQEFDDYCRETGWTRVCSRGKMHIYSSEEETPIPIETDESLKLENVSKSIVHSYVIPMLIIVACLSMGGSGFISFLTNPAELFSRYSNMLIGLITLIIVLLVGVSIVRLFVWVKRSRKSIEAGGRCVPTAGFRRGQKAISYLVYLLLLLWAVSLFTEERRSVAFAMIGFAVMLLGIGVLIRELMQRLRMAGVSRSKNRMITIGLCIVCTFAAVFGLAAWLATIMDDEDSWSDADKKNMTLLAEDLRDIGDVQYEYKCNHTKTFLMEMECGEQNDTGDEISSGNQNEKETYSLNYEILRVKNEWLYDRCLKQWMEEGIGLNGIMGIPDDPKDGYYREEIDGVHADRVYQYYWDGNPDDDWLLCYSGMIVRFTPYFGFTEKDLKKVDQIVCEK